MGIHTEVHTSPYMATGTLQMWLRTWRWGLILDYSATESNREPVNAENSPVCGQREGPEMQRCWPWRWRKGPEAEERGGLWELEKAGISERTSPTDTLILVQRDPRWTENLKNF